MSDLVDRLQSWTVNGPSPRANEACGEAADRITQLEADRAELGYALAAAIRSGIYDEDTALFAKTTLTKMEARP